jgi:hypothetical protein
MKYVPFSQDAKDIFVQLEDLDILKSDAWKNEKSSMPIDPKRSSKRMSRSLENVQYCH